MVQAYANDVPPNNKQILPVLIINNSYSETKPSFANYKLELPPILIDQITKSLNTKYEIKILNNDYNITDLPSTEKNDLLDLFKGTDYYTVILVEILPIHFHTVHIFMQLHIKIIDIKNEKYLYNGKIWRDKGGGVGGVKAINDMSNELDNILKNVFKL